MNLFSKNTLFPLFLVALFAQNTAAQCPVSDISLWTQPEVDSFPLKYPDCKKIDGNLWVVEDSWHPGPPVENLHGLLGIDSVMGEIAIGRHKQMPNLDGLDSLRFVGGDFSIGTNEQLNSFAALHNLRRIDGELWVLNAPSLKNFHGLENLTRAGGIRIEEMSVESLQGFNNLRVAGSFVVQKTGLQNMEGLEKLDSVLSQLYLGEMPRLKALNGLENLRHAESMTLNALDSLTNLHGLEGLKSGAILQFSGNKRLESLDGLENLQSLTGQFIPAFPLKLPAMFITNNPKLHDLSALDHPISMGIGIQITDNPSLSACSVEAICTLLGQAPDTVTIIGNLANCNSDAEILSFCAVPTTGFSRKTGFEIFPCPISDGEPLQISLENDFLGKVRIEVLGLDGRVISVFEKGKTAHREVFEISDLPKAGPFFVRVSDGRTSSARLVLKV